MFLWRGELILLVLLQRDSNGFFQLRIIAISVHLSV